MRVISSPAFLPSSISTRCTSAGSDAKYFAFIGHITKAVKCPVVEITLRVSCSFEPQSEPSGASAACTTFCCSALYTSDHCTVVGRAPIALKVSIHIVFGGTRTVMPAMSAGVRTGLSAIRWRWPKKPLAMMSLKPDCSRRFSTPLYQSEASSLS